MIQSNNYRKPNKPQTGPKEEYAIVLDIISDNSSFKNQELVHAIGLNTYSLFELVPKSGAIIKSGQKVYIGDGKRDEIQYIKRVLYYDKLSGTSSSELPFVIEEIVEEKEEEFVKFFNNAGPISLRRHSLEIIPGIGKKHLQTLIDIRQEKPFESFADITKRCPFLGEPVKALSQRILEEIKGEVDIRFFVRR